MLGYRNIFRGYYVIWLCILYLPGTPIYFSLNVYTACSCSVWCGIVRYTQVRTWYVPLHIGIKLSFISKTRTWYTNIFAINIIWYIKWSGLFICCLHFSFTFTKNKNFKKICSILRVEVALWIVMVWNFFIQNVMNGEKTWISCQYEIKCPKITLSLLSNKNIWK